MLLYFLISLVRNQKRNLELYERYSKAEINAMEKERSRIANDLHDDIAPVLTIIKKKMSDLPYTNEKEIAQKNEIEKEITEVLGRVREVSFNLMPASLLRTGLHSAIVSIVKHVEKNYGIDIGFRAEEGMPIPANISIHIYRIVHEVVHNAIKHAQATQMLIEFDVKDDRLILKISDDGIGINYEAKLDESTGLGLRSIQNRVHLLNGQMSIHSKKGDGVRYVFEIPLPGELITDDMDRTDIH
jgi:signal transduction histidine kinase